MELSGKTCLVTGALGFVGRALCERLLSEGCAVRAGDALIGEPAVDAPSGCEPVFVDITRPDTVAEAVKGADVVFHAAARVTDIGPAASFFEVNHIGARNVFEASLACGVERVLFLSTVVTMGLVPPDGADEESPTLEMGFPYGDAKIRAEADARRMHAEQDLPVTIVRPANVYGPGSTVWVHRPLELAEKGLLRVFGDGSGHANHVFIDNLIDGVFLAATNDAAIGRTYIISDGAETTWKHYFDRINQLVGKGPVGTLPFGVALALARAMELRHRWTGTEPLFTPGAVRFTHGSGRYSIARARRELGYSPRVRLGEGMRRIELSLRAPP